MSHLYQHMAARVEVRRAGGYTGEAYRVIAEILEWAQETEMGNLRSLHRLQIRALETCWYLRPIERMPHILDLYRKVFTNRRELLDSILRPEIDDWRIMVDYVIIDPTHHCQVFIVALSECAGEKTNVAAGDTSLMRCGVRRCDG